MANPKYRLTLVFASGGPQAVEGMLAAEELLREELWTGLTAGHEFKETDARLFVTTPYPQRCLDDIRRRLCWLGMTPASASFELLAEVKGGDFRPIGKAESLSINSKQSADV